MQFHLPLSPTDRILQPPVQYLVIQDVNLLYCSFAWTVAYVLYVRQAFRDQSYGMPIATLFLNVAWEFIFGVVMPTSPGQVVIFVPWLIIDLGIIYTTIKFAPKVWRDSPLVASNMGTIIATGLAGALVLVWTVIATVGREDASFYLAFGDQLLISALSIAHLLKRGDTSGHSLGIWFWRASGSLIAVFAMQWRYWHYPATFERVGTPLSTFLFVVASVLDLVYPVFYLAFDRKEKRVKLQ